MTHRSGWLATLGFIGGYLETPFPLEHLANSLGLGNNAIESAEKLESGVASAAHGTVATRPREFLTLACSFVALARLL